MICRYCDHSGSIALDEQECGCFCCPECGQTVVEAAEGCELAEQDSLDAMQRGDEP